MKYILSILALMAAFGSIAQKNPVSWQTSVKQLGGDEAELILTATIDKGWHLYSQFIPEGGPIPTSFTFVSSPDFELIGKVTEGKAHEEFDPNFDMVLKYFDTKAVFKQKIKIRSSKDFVVSGELEFMVCNDQMCLPPEFIDTRFSVKGASAVTETTIESEKTETVAADDTTTKPLPSEETAADTTQSESATTAIADEPTEKKSEPALWGIFIVGFLGGLAALLMPCIFPMIPLTVSFFTKQSKTKSEGIRKAAIYGLSIIVIYVALGMGVSLVFGADTLNQMATNPTFNIIFFALFVIFAISFFGAFEITLPSSWVNKADEASNKGGLIGIFFMAFTLSLVSFSCTGPIIGSLLVEAASNGSYYGPATGMFGFAFALALPFALFAAFPGWLNSLPKSGGWLNTVKVSLGFLELAFAFKFLSTADMVMQTHWLEREMFMAIWVAITFLLALYLLGVYKTPNDSPVDRISVSRLLFSTFFFVLAFYMLPGIWGAPVKLISGFPPPEHYAEVKGGAFASGGHAAPAAVQADGESVAFGAHCPFDLSCFNDFEAGLAYAKKVGKPVMLDFTGWGCVNCRRMEENVWSDPRVLKRLRENVVLISLYVDERTPLADDQQYVSEKTGRKIKNVGNVWTEFQETNFQAVSQPYYIFLNHDSMKPLIEPAAYDPDINKFIDWLDRGVKAFEEGK
jgi:thiol:disulfide interchange protein